MSVELFLDPDDSRPMSTQLYDQLRTAIVEGRLEPGDRLTPSRTAAADLGVARATVTDAYGRLSAEGWVEGRSGGGSVVSATQPPLPAPASVAGLTPTGRSAAITSYDSDPGAGARFDCRAGRVDDSLFPVADWRRCVVRTLDRPPGQYGDPAGTPQLREALANWVSRSRGVTASAARMFVTSGAGHAVDLVARVLTEPGATVAVEEPGYPPVTSLLLSQGLRVAGVPVDADGIVVDAVPPEARIIYVTPSHQYPLGMVMSRRRRLELLDRAARTGAAVVEDDYDSEYRYTARPLEPLQRLDGNGRVVYVGTFSKSLSPALRVGFLVAPETLLPALRAVRQAMDWCPPATTQQALTQFIAGGHLDRHLRRTRRRYAERHRLMREALDRLLPAGYDHLPAEAGLHHCVTGPLDPADSDLWAALLRHGLQVSSLRRCYASAPPRPGLLLGFGAVAASDVSTAVRALRSAIDAVR